MSFYTCGGCWKLIDGDIDGDGGWIIVKDEVLGRDVLVYMCPKCQEERKTAVEGKI
jgi:hypothetical protein